MSSCHLQPPRPPPGALGPHHAPEKNYSCLLPEPGPGSAPTRTACVTPEESSEPLVSFSGSYTVKGPARPCLITPRSLEPLSSLGGEQVSAVRSCRLAQAIVFTVSSAPKAV